MTPEFQERKVFDWVRIPVEDRALSLKEAEEAYGVPMHRLRLYRARRELDFFKLGKRVFVSERSLIAFLERHRQPAKAVPAQKL